MKTLIFSTLNGAGFLQSIVLKDGDVSGDGMDGLSIKESTPERETNKSFSVTKKNSQVL